MKLNADLLCLGCEICGKLYKNRFSLNNHRSLKHPEFVKKRNNFRNFLAWDSCSLWCQPPFNLTWCIVLSYILQHNAHITVSHVCCFNIDYKKKLLNTLMPMKIGLRRKFVTNSLFFESEIKPKSRQLNAAGLSHFVFWTCILFSTRKLRYFVV